MAHPLFSCVMPVKGARPFMGAALESLRNQGMGDDLEIIIQDADIEPDLGQSDALNKGFAKAHGEWLFWLNADDVLLSGALEKVKKIIHSTTTTSDYDSLSWIAGNVAYLDESGKVIRCAWDLGWKTSYLGLPVQVYGPSCFFRRELLEECGPFDLSLHYAMDIDMWCKFRAAGYWYRKADALTWGFRIHSGSKTHDAQTGGWPEFMEKEHRILNARYELRHIEAFRRLANLMRLVNGSYLKSWNLTRKLRGRDWKTL